MIMSPESADTVARNLKTVKEFYAAVDAGDWTGAEDIFDFDNLILIEADGMPYGGTWQGREAFIRFNEMIYNLWQPLQYKMLEYCAGGDLVICYLQLTGTGKTGVSWSMTVCEPWRLRNGKVVEIKPHYFDTHRLRQIDGRLP
jgi:ketosteroid isomerase-like protein